MDVANENKSHRTCPLVPGQYAKRLIYLSPTFILLVIMATPAFSTAG
jgi:hypothetical protein